MTRKDGTIAPTKVGQIVVKHAVPDGYRYVVIGEYTSHPGIAYATQHGLPHPLERKREGWHVQCLDIPRLLGTYPSADLDVVE